MLPCVHKPVKIYKKFNYKHNKKSALKQGCNEMIKG